MHTAVCGVTKTGKSYFCKTLARQYKAQGQFRTLCYDPIGDDEWKGIVDFYTTDKAEFLDVYYGSTNCRAFFEECGDLNRHKDVGFEMSARRGRHWGHYNFYISQQWQKIPPGIRSQCSRVYSFRQGREDAKLLAAAFGNEDLKEVSNLDKGEYIAATAFSAETHKLF